MYGAHEHADRLNTIVVNMLPSLDITSQSTTFGKRRFCSVGGGRCCSGSAGQRRTSRKAVSIWGCHAVCRAHRSVFCTATTSKLQHSSLCVNRHVRPSGQLALRRGQPHNPALANDPTSTWFAHPKPQAFSELAATDSDASISHQRAVWQGAADLWTTGKWAYISWRQLGEEREDV